MDYVEGRSLSTLLREGPLPAARAACFLEKIARAVHYAHEQGILHRDLKPSNVLLDAQDEPHVTDFGLAKRLTHPEPETPSSELTLSGQVLGTPSFMPPEQASGQREQMGPRSDVYSLGAILYHLLTARPPFVGADVQAIIGQVIHSEVIAPRLLNPTIPRDLETIALKCLEKEPARRYESARALADDLARHHNHEPILAVPPSTVYRARKFVRRHRMGVAVSGAFVLLLAAGVIVSSVLAVRANLEKTRALKAEKAARTEADKSAQVSLFLQDMLKSAGPSVAKGRDAAMLREILDRTAGRIDTELRNQPEVEISLRLVLGRTYHDLGDFSKAEKILREALRLARATPGIAPSQLARCLNYLGNVVEDSGTLTEVEALQRESLRVLRSASMTNNANLATGLFKLGSTVLRQGNLREAEELHREALEMRKRLFGDASPEIAPSLVGMSQVLKAKDDFAGAEALLRQALALIQKAREPMDSTVVESLDSLGLLLKEQKRFAEAEPTFRQVLERQKKVFGESHPKVADALGNLGAMLSDKGDLAEAERVYQEALAMRIKWLGNNHPDVTLTMKCFAMLHASRGSFAEAETTLRQVLERELKQYGSNHLGVATSYHNLGRLAARRGARKDAAVSYREAVRIRQNLLTVKHSDTQESMRALLRIYWNSDQLPETRSLLAELVAVERTKPSSSADLAEHLAMLADCHMLQKEYPKAEPLLQEAFQIFVKQQPGRSSAFESQSLLGWAQFRQGKYAEAVTNLWAGYEGLKKRDAESPSASHARSIKEAGERIVRLYEAWEKPEQAAEWRGRIER